MADVQNECPTVADGLEINEVPDGLVIYDPARDRVHTLNATAAVVFTLCDGTEDLESLAEDVAQAYELAEPPVAQVEACVDHLRAEGLVR